MRQIVALSLLASISACAHRGGADGRAMTYVYTSGGSDQVRVFSLDVGSGAIAQKSAVATGVIRPNYLAFSPDKKLVYGVGATGTPALGRVVAFRIDPATGAITKLDAETETGATGGTHIAVHPSGRWLLTAHFQSGQASVIAVGADGAPGALSQRLDVAPEAHQVVIDRNFVFVPCRVSNVVHQLLFDEAKGRLVPNDPGKVPATASGAGPRHMYLAPGKKHAYVINELQGTATTYAYDDRKGVITPVDTIGAVPAGFEEDSSAHILVHPNAQLAYASNRKHHSIAVFSVGSDGRLRLQGNETGGGSIRQPRNFTIDPSGRWLLVVNQLDGKLLVFAIDQTTGKLTLTGTPIEGLGNPSYVGAITLP